MATRPQIHGQEADSSNAQVLAGFAAAVRQFLDHDRLSIYLLSPNGQYLERFAVTTSLAVPGEHSLIPIEDVGLTYVIRTNEVLVSPDLAIDPRIGGKEDRLIASAGFHGLLSAPLRLSGRAIGVLNFVSHIPGYYVDEDAAIAQRIADLVAVFVENLRLERELREAAVAEGVHRERLRLTADLRTAGERPLRQLASKLTKLATEGNQAGRLRQGLLEIQEQVTQLMDVLRRISSAALPSGSEDEPLTRSIEGRLLAFEREHGLRVDFQADRVAAPDDLSREERSAILHIVQEALANVTEHADATSITVRLADVDASHLSVTIEDNGRGIAFSDAKVHDGIGFRAMRERAELVGGHLLVTSTLSQGTRVQLALVRKRHASVSEGPRARARVSGHDHAKIARVLLAESHPLVRDSLTQMLNREGDIRVVASAGSHADTFALTKLLRPDLVLLDVTLAGGGGDAALVRRLRQVDKPPIVLILSDHPTGEEVKAAMRAGASGHITKAVDTASLAESIRTVMRGSMILDRPSASALWKTEEEAELSKRQLDILQRVARGETNAEMAKGLYLAPKTVERIVATVVGKLGARNRAHAAAIAVARRVISPPADDN